MSPKRVAILISGRGSNMVSLVEAMQDGRIPAEPALVLANLPDAAGLERAAALGVPTRVIDHRELKPRRRHDAAVVAALDEARIDLVCLAGYMRLITGLFVEAYRHRILNIHPSLLPAFPGLHAQRQALEYGVRQAGCTVHFVDEQTDHGPIVLQAAVPVLDGDDEATLAARILEHEHALYVDAVRLWAEGRLAIDGRRVRILDPVVPSPPPRGATREAGGGPQPDRG